MTVHYVLIDSQSRIVQRGVCSSASDIPDIPGLRCEIVDREDQRIPSNDLVATYADARRLEFPSVGDQLGAIWKAIAPLIKHPEAEEILAKIQAVKAANPKT